MIRFELNEIRSLEEALEMREHYEKLKEVQKNKVIYFIF